VLIDRANRRPSHTASPTDVFVDAAPHEIELEGATVGEAGHQRPRATTKRRTIATTRRRCILLPLSAVLRVLRPGIQVIQNDDSGSPPPARSVLYPGFGLSLRTHLRFGSGFRAGSLTTSFGSQRGVEGVQRG
jgi:hypothetical protein